MTAVVSSPNGIKNTLFKNGNTNDIINSILYADAKDTSDVSILAKQLKGNTDLQTCSNIWDYIKNNIQYKIDPPGQQFIKSPAKLFADKTGDCKSFSIFYASLLKALKIPYKYRFASYDTPNEYTHVYVIANNSIICDAVMPVFNKEKNYKYKKDFSMTQIKYMSGIGASSERSAKTVDPIVDFQQAYDLAMMMAIYDYKEPAIRKSGITQRMEISLADIVKLYDQGVSNINNIDENRISGIFKFLKNAFLNIVGGIVQEKIDKIKSWLNKLNHIGDPFPGFHLSIGPKGGILLTGDSNVLFALNDNSSTNTEAKNILINNLANKIVASVSLSNIENKQFNAVNTTPKIDLSNKKAVSKKSFKVSLKNNTTSSKIGYYSDTNYSDAFKEGIRQVLGEPYATISREWTVWKVAGGVGEVCDYLAGGANSPCYWINPGTQFSATECAAAVNNLVNILMEANYHAHQTKAAIRLLNYLYGTNMQYGDQYFAFTVNLPTPASTALSIVTTATPPETTLQKADNLLNTGATTLAVYNVLIGGGMSKNNALAWLISKGRSVTEILGNPQSGGGSGTGRTGGADPNANANKSSSSNVLVYAGGALALLNFLK